MVNSFQKFLKDLIKQLPKFVCLKHYSHILFLDSTSIGSCTTHCWTKVWLIFVSNVFIVFHLESMYIY